MTRYEKADKRLLVGSERLLNLYRVFEDEDLP